MKLEFDLNFMGIFYLLLAVTLVFMAVLIFTTLPQFSSAFPFDPLHKFIYVLQITAAVVMVLFLVPVIRRLFKAFMPSA